jgi:hypothetical protein
MQSAHEHLLGPLHLAVALTATARKPYEAPPHLRLLNDELVQLWKRDKDWPRNLMVFMPPGHAKSETCSHWFPVWNLSLDPTTLIIETSYEADFAKRWGTASRRTVEEHWLAPRGKNMLNAGRTMKGDILVEFEQVVLREEGDRLAYQAHPSGQPSAVFMSKSLGEGTVVFENLEHDFPQRVGYDRKGDTLVGWIEGAKDGKTRRIEFPYKRVPCPGN